MDNQDMTKEWEGASLHLTTYTWFPIGFVNMYTGSLCEDDLNTFVSER